MRLRVPIDERLDVPLLIAGQIESAQTLHPVVLKFRFAGRRVWRRLVAGRRILLS
jgi:hypothetical protein